jgi:hypothetical protein
MALSGLQESSFAVGITLPPLNAEANLLDGPGVFYALGIPLMYDANLKSKA